MRDRLLAHFCNVLNENEKKFTRVHSWNSWLEGESYSIFVRISTRVFRPNDKYHKCFDLSNITIYEPGKGHFTALLDYLEKSCPYTLYVENVTSKRFQKFLLKRGYTLIPLYFEQGPPSFYKHTVISQAKLERATQRG